MNANAMYNLTYGLFVVTTNVNGKDYGCIVNTGSQVANPNKIAISVNKANYTCEMIQQSKTFTLSVLSESAVFDVFKHFGFQSGRNVDKFEGFEPLYSDNGLAFLPRYINSFMSLTVEQYIDLDTHGMFICSVGEARVISDKETMTYAYYHENVKPKPKTDGKKGYVCKICGYLYEGEELPEDFICPLCKHGAADFEEVK
jgi:flavin reductase (DIM6/NTAB) family NADH-FMN oxidoreductase RutF